MTLESWGRFPRTLTAEEVRLDWAGAPLPARRPLLAHGLGRSYGDSCLNDGGVLLHTRGLDRFLAMDAERGLLTCEAGVSLGEILRLVVPRGFFLPVVPGTRHVTVGGAIANDIHGKNHHRAGTFGAQVVSLDLLRSTGERLRCSREENAALFAATVGGLGLTGIIVAATLRLRPILRSAIDAETLPIHDLEEFFAVSRDSDARFEYTVAWIDCLARGGSVGRGILHRGNHFEVKGPLRPPPRDAKLSMPELPVSPLNRLTIAAFNSLYYAKNRLAAGRRSMEPDAFFFPLDGVGRWNRVYGRRGMLQFQSVVPPDVARDAVRELLSTIARSGEGSFLAVLKNFGSVPSPGLLSFPRPGTTLALDFPYRGASTERLFQALYATVRSAGGRIYPAKDALMPAEQFRTQYADSLEAFRAQLDPAFSSSLWRRLIGA